MIRPFALSLLCCLAPTVSSAVVIPEAEVTKTREVGQSVTEEMRIYGSDGTHITAIVTRTPVTVTYTLTTGWGLQPGDMAQLAEDAVQCDTGTPDNAWEETRGDQIIFEFNCLSR